MSSLINALVVFPDNSVLELSWHTDDVKADDGLGVIISRASDYTANTTARRLTADEVNILTDIMNNAYNAGLFKNTNYTFTQAVRILDKVWAEYPE